MNRPSINLKCLLVSALVLFCFGVLAAIAFIQSGLFNVAADHPHYALEYWAFTTTRQRSVELRATDVEVPDELDNTRQLNSGARLYDEHCAQCHLHPGAEPNALHRGLNPVPPRLDEWSEAPAYTFVVVKHGVRSTGMPAWSPTLSDMEIWNVIAFQRQLLSMSEEEYHAAVQAAAENVRKADMP